MRPQEGRRAKRAELNRVKEGDIVLAGRSRHPAGRRLHAGAEHPVLHPLQHGRQRQTVMFTILINQNGDVETVRLLQKSNNAS